MPRKFNSINVERFCIYQIDFVNDSIKVDYDIANYTGTPF